MIEKQFNGLLVVNCELTSRCNKSCWMCGRRKIEKEYPHLANWGDMDFELVELISRQLPENVIVQFHNNGESLLYQQFGDAIKLFKNQIKCLDTNGKLLLEKADEIIDNLDTITISVVENDPEQDKQYEITKKFLEIKGDRKPFVVYRLLGNVGLLQQCDIDYHIDYHNLIIYEDLEDKERRERWHRLPGIVASRILHNPMGSYGYTKKPTIPEIGICLDILSHLVIDRLGNVYPCIRFNPYKHNLLGNIKEKPLVDIWNGNYRKYLIEQHIKGDRNYSQLCAKCEFYGIPTS